LQEGDLFSYDWVKTGFYPEVKEITLSLCPLYGGEESETVALVSE